jgi:tetratricopeptide (TPR) repeat protein
VNDSQPFDLRRAGFLVHQPETCCSSSRFERVRILNPKRVLIAIAASAALCWVSWYCLRIGYARTLVRVAAITGNAALADHAASVSLADVEAQATLAELLVQSGNHAEAMAALDRAVRLRPRDYYLWLELGQARDQMGDQEAALRAFRQATALAPSYANARWQLGNLLLRMGRLYEAFEELRRAESSNPDLAANVADLAWGVYRPNSAAVAAAFKPRTDLQHMTLAIVFATHGENTAAVEQFLLAGGEARMEAQTLLRLLLQAKAFSEAYPVWAKLHGVADNGLGVIHDGGFEEPLLLGDAGFAWQITPGLTNVMLSVDEGNREHGSKSLRIEFRGNSDPSGALLTQIVLVNPQTHYRLTFAARSQQFVSAAQPIVTISDASDKTSTILVQSPPVNFDSPEWRGLEMSFTAGPQTRAITVAIRRQTCSESPCPAFGMVWWDSFFLTSAGARVPDPVSKMIDAVTRS